MTARRSPSCSRCSGGSRGAAYRLRWTPTAILLASIVLALACASGCGTRTVFVPDESPMRLGPGASAKVYHRVAGEWTLSENAIALPEGWYIVPSRYVEEKP